MSNKIINEQRIKDNTTHFTSSEFACKCGGKYCDGHPDVINAELLKYLEQIRSYFGNKPVHITSALRCRQHNKNEGGVSNSKHLYGLAVDFYIKNVTADRIIAYVKTLPNYRYAYKIVGDVVHLDVVYKPVADDGKIKITGELDKATIKALQKFLKVSEDGIIGKQTATALQEWLSR